MLSLWGRNNKSGFAAAPVVGCNGPAGHNFCVLSFQFELLKTQLWLFQSNLFRLDQKHLGITESTGIKAALWIHGSISDSQDLTQQTWSWSRTRNRRSSRRAVTHRSEQQTPPSLYTAARLIGCSCLQPLLVNQRWSQTTATTSTLLHSSRPTSINELIFTGNIKKRTINRIIYNNYFPWHFFHKIKVENLSMQVF